MCFKKTEKDYKTTHNDAVARTSLQVVDSSKRRLHTTTNNILVNVVIKLRPLQKSGSKMSEMYLS